MLPLTMDDGRLYQSMSSVVGGCYESSCDTLPQPLMLTGFRQSEAIQHHVVDAYNLSVAFAKRCELLVLRAFARHQLVSVFLQGYS
jgi:hypothetical protein